MKAVIGFNGSLNVDLMMATPVLKHSQSDADALALYFSGNSLQGYTENEIREFEQRGQVTLFSQQVLKQYRDLLCPEPLQANTPMSILLSARRLFERFQILSDTDWSPSWNPLLDTSMFFAIATTDAVQKWLNIQASWFLLLAQREMARYSDPKENGAKQARSRAEIWTADALLAAQKREIQITAYALRAVIVGQDQWRGEQRKKTVLQSMVRRFRLTTDEAEKYAEQQMAEVREHEKYKNSELKNLEEQILKDRQVVKAAKAGNRIAAAWRAAQRYWPVDDSVMNQVNEKARKEKMGAFYTAEADHLFAIAAQPPIYLSEIPPFAESSRDQSKMELSTGSALFVVYTPALLYSSFQTSDVVSTVFGNRRETNSRYRLAMKSMKSKIG